MTRLYLDHNATSPLRLEARRAFESVARGPCLGNPSSAHAEGRRARRLLEEARERLAHLVGARRDDIVFTSGGTEANALAVTAAAPGSVIACSPLEHPSVLQAASLRGRLVLLALAEGSRVIHAPAPLVPRDAVLVSVALANHEVGLLQDVQGLADTAHRAGQLMHSDACQAFGRIPVDVTALDVDLMTLSSHKLGGPVGIGALIVRRGVRIEPLLRGGGQEGGWRAGTEPAVLAHAFAAAAEAAVAEVPAAIPRWQAALDELRKLMSTISPEAVVHSSATQGLPQTLNVSFPGRRGPSIVHKLDLEGVSVSHGSACATGSLEPSPVLLALGLSEELARSSVRVSLGHGDDVGITRAFAERLARVLTAMPRRSPEEIRGASGMSNG